MTKLPQPTKKKSNLDKAIENVSRLRVSNSAKTALTTIITAKAKPEGESLEFALKHLTPERLEIVNDTAQSVGKVTKGIRARGRAALMEMSDEEWDKMVNNG